MEEIAIQTEEDYQELVKVLENHGVEVLRPTIGDPSQHLVDGRLTMPPSTPRDYTAMIDSRFFMDRRPGIHGHYSQICDRILSEGNSITWDEGINTATIFRLGDKLYCGAPETGDEDVWQAVRQPHWPERIPINAQGKLPANMINDTRAKAAIEAKTKDHHDKIKQLFPEHHHHFYNFQGHIDGCFCPVKPGLVLSLRDIQDYSVTFPDWEIIYLDDSALAKRREFNELKNKNNGRWWVPGEESNDEFTEFVETYLNHWMGFVEETVFDVNILMIDEKNAICTNYSDQVLKAFDRHGINPIQVNFRHRYFWDGGIHCITSDLHRGH